MLNIFKIKSRDQEIKRSRGPLIYKSISGLMAVILLIVIAVVLIILILSWGKNFTQESTSKTDLIKYDRSDISYSIFLKETIGNRIFIDNKHKTESVTITGYKLNSFDFNGSWLNSIHDLNNPLTLEPGQTNYIDVICIPNKKFSITLYTDNKKYIDLASHTGDHSFSSCSVYEVPLFSFQEGSGSYEVKEYNIEQGELVTNGDFENGLIGSMTDGLGSESTYTINTVNPISGLQDAILEVTTPAHGRPIMGISNNLVLANRKVKISFDYVVNSGTPKVMGIYDNSGVDYINETLNGTGTFTHNLFYVTDNTKTTLYWTSSEPFEIQIDNFSKKEIPPLPNFNTGTKYLENTTAGTTAIQSQQAYGTWEFDVYKGAETNNLIYSPISPDGSAFPGNGTYWLILGSSENIRLYKDGATTLFVTATSYVSNNTWYRIKIQRLQSEGIFPDLDDTIYPANTFAVFIKGGSFGDTYQLVDATGGSGTNPKTDSTYTTSNYFVSDLDAGDKFTNLKIYDYIKEN